MNRRVFDCSTFLLKLVKNPKLISKADLSEIGCVVELFFNIHKIGLTRAEYNKVVRFLPIIRHIGKIRDYNKA